MSSNRRRTRRAAPSMGTVLVAAAVTYGTYRLASWAWDTWIRRDDHEDDPCFLQQQRDARGRPNQSKFPNRRRIRSQRMARCRDEVAIAMHDFLPTLKRNIETLTETTKHTKGLKLLRNSQDDDRRLKEKELWNVIKVKAMTRLIATAYAHTILFLVLTTQVFLLGGKLLQEQMQVSENSSSAFGSVSSDKRMSSYQASHRIVLTQTYDFFFDKGIGLLVKAVERAVESVIGDWDVTHPSSIHTTKEMLEKAILDICNILEGRSLQYSQRRARSILKFLLPLDHGLDCIVENDLAQSIMDETLDILESPVFDDAQRDCFRTTMTILQEKSLSAIFLEKSVSQHESSPWGSKPLATVLSKLKCSSNTFYELSEVPDSLISQPPKTFVNLYLPTIHRLPTVFELEDISFN